MLCDFNKPWSETSFGTRAGLTAVHMCEIPVSIVRGIITVAKALFYAIACAFTFNKSDALQAQFRASLAGALYDATAIAISVLGFFAPINACEWKAKSMTNITDFFTPSNPSNSYLLSLQAGASI